MQSFLKSLFSRLSPAASNVPAKRRTSHRSRIRPGLECLEDRQVPTASISGLVTVDPSGNGFRVSNPGQGGVTVKLFQDTNNNGKLDSTDLQAAPAQITPAGGSYSFLGLAPGKYFVSEVTPSGYVRTTPTSAAYYTVDLADNQFKSDVNFSNFKKLNTAAISNITYTVTSPSGVSTVVTNLRGNTHQGDTVTANFKVNTNQTVVSLISYDAPGATFNANNASQQVPIEIATGTFAAGMQSLTVHIPNNYYQVDFVLGSAIDQFGPAGSNIFFSAQGRLLSADNNGTQAAAPTLSGMVFDTSLFPPSVSSHLTLTLVGTDATGNPLPTITGMLDTVTGFFSFAGLQNNASYVLVVTDDSGTYQTFSSSPITISNNASISGFEVLLDNTVPT